jgi:hypothetical protein
VEPGSTAVIGVGSPFLRLVWLLLPLWCFVLLERRSRADGRAGAPVRYGPAGGRAAQNPAISAHSATRPM